MGILIWYVLPFLLVVLLTPKSLAAGFMESYPEFQKPVRIRHIILSVVLGSLFIVNILVLLMILVFYVMHHDSVYKGSFLDKPLFK